MRIGALRSRVELFSFSSTRDTAGQLSFSYTSEGNVWAQVEQTVTDVTNAEGIDQLDSYTITMHFDPDITITKGWQITHSARTLEVMAVHSDADIREVTIVSARTIR